MDDFTKLLFWGGAEDNEAEYDGLLIRLMIEFKDAAPRECWHVEREAATLAEGNTEEALRKWFNAYVLHQGCAILP